MNGYTQGQTEAGRANAYRQGEAATLGNVVPVPVAAIPSATSALTNATERLHAVISALAQRLEPILAPQPPAPVGESTKNAARHSLAQLIDSEAAKTHGAVDRLEAILSRLEL